ncbi:MAG TPA: HAMP domain-containing histidine kinase [Candidatus Merdicola faecigallinarum]|uniref:histidine kinase n=1 Tax=Candidatus Merdicola faecigallinarum TaxID=2840862 RepID=A0A9D1S9U7_9FIRM|nr:HAMP domain-containing histidine kinase [Candidatus Merdicola faecigallinarum]
MKNNNSLTKTKIKIGMELLGNILIAGIISFILYFILVLFFENTLSILVARLNYDLYAWIVYNREIVLYIYVGIVLAIILYRFISKYVNSINEVYKSLDRILEEDNETIKLPDNMNQFAEKINEIKYNYISTKNSERDAEQKKNDLIMYMAHDLKTPLTSIIGYLTLLSDEKEIPKKLQEKYINIALNKSLRVEELINQFFDITRYNLHAMPIIKNEINIAYLLKQLVDECYPMLENKGLCCKLNTPDKIMYLGDGDKLARAFDNLLKNAINYSFEGSTIEINLLQKEDKILISFRNKGEKIPEYKLEKIFEKFYRGDEARISSTGGAGLGLAITKEIIELHEGSIKVKNDDEYIEFDIEL